MSTDALGTPLVFQDFIRYGKHLLIITSESKNFSPGYSMVDVRWAKAASGLESLSFGLLSIINRPPNRCFRLHIESFT